ncbi:MAG: NADH-quinone oxidoreductase subunit L [Chloroflexi bacterium AL-W]|nr:NADH-quinone oxidoreductase subunit L [Chloroflexi bacterium AL-N1]NOK66118.1 NADH-quinone oxidoreductase subunit L [Chloroflexi bacterium AL-N10]NOK72999.1 NADH-quinone oxidoreductase subunit L [Chloroflexi bacterium AL-N5]NOK79896.1 NADH-quinone oxidoreductase subunit L [Chloroflexi bacterium AL-W]NOK88248.1 NADH-quinone oxidoreductase subunit L [Chloroflexi bacterium AL-N15]
MGAFLEFAWLIPLFPLLGFAIITLAPIRSNQQLSGWLATILMVASTVVALGVGTAVAQGIQIGTDGTTGIAPTHDALASVSHIPAAAGYEVAEPNITRVFRWAPTGGDTAFTMGYTIDSVVAAMLVMVTIASTCIHLFSLGYMSHDNRQARFFSFIALFTAAMLLMVMSSNLLLFFMAWEVMGLCSYLLIGFWYDKNYTDPNQITPRQAAIKAFITTRIGDVLLLIGLVYLWTQAGSLDFGTGEGQIFNPTFLGTIAEAPAALGMTSATAIALLIFAGTVGKSAQFPLHVWLPDAMEGPTPVSALIHAATMVAAGVFLVARTFPIFDVSGALPFVTAIGAITALGAALIAVAQFDIKRILAYSTISQLGFMIVALGVGGWVAAIFHLLTHAFFKALLFLGSGSVIHGMEVAVGHDSNTAQDIRNMGGLRKKMPWTFATYLIGSLALAGIAPFAGFWSKDEILADAFGHNLIAWVALSLAAFLTAFYMARQVILVFFGEFRGHNPRRDGQSKATTHDHGKHDPHESPNVMIAPLAILALFATFAGFANLPGIYWLSSFLGQGSPEFNILTAIIATVLSLAGIGLGWMLYRNAFTSAMDTDPLERSASAAFGILNRKFAFDELYAGTIGRLTTLIASAWAIFDRVVIDGLVDGTGRLTGFLGRINFIVDDTLFNDGADRLADGTMGSGDRVRRIETGKIQDYAALIFGGVVLFGIMYLYVFS